MRLPILPEGIEDYMRPTMVYVNPVFHPRKHTKMSYRTQQRNARKRRNIRARKSKRKNRQR